MIIPGRGVLLAGWYSGGDYLRRIRYPVYEQQLHVWLITAKSGCLQRYTVRINRMSPHYTAGSMPLAFTQEDFLVNNYSSSTGTCDNSFFVKLYSSLYIKISSEKFLRRFFSFSLILINSTCLIRTIKVFVTMRQKRLWWNIKQVKSDKFWIFFF